MRVPFSPHGGHPIQGDQSIQGDQWSHDADTRRGSQRGSGCRDRLVDSGPGEGRAQVRATASGFRRRRIRAHALDRCEPGHRVCRRARRGARVRAGADAGAVPGGRLPLSGEVRLPQCRDRRRRPCCASGAHGVRPLSAPVAVRRSHRGARRGARRRAAAAGSPRRSRRDGGQRAVGRPPADRGPRGRGRAACSSHFARRPPTER